MDLTSRVKSFRSRQGQALSWILSTGRRPKVVVAMGDRLSLLLIGQILTSPESLLAAVTTEHEAIASIQLERPSLLICAPPLEAGCTKSLCSAARKLVDDIQILAIVNERCDPLSWAELDPLVDVAISTNDLSGEEYPLARGFVELARKGRYRSIALRKAVTEELDGLTQGKPRLTPREVEILELLSKGLKDRQIAEQLGISHHTARTYVKDLRRKLGARNRLIAVLRGLTHT